MCRHRRQELRLKKKMLDVYTNSKEKKEKKRNKNVYEIMLMYAGV